MTEQALVKFEGEYVVKITKIPSEGNGTAERRVARCAFLPYSQFIFLFTDCYDPLPSIKQSDSKYASKPIPKGSLIYTTQPLSSWLRIHKGLLYLRILLDRLIKDGHIVTEESRSGSEPEPEDERPW